MTLTDNDTILKLAREMSAAFQAGPRDSTDTGRPIRVLGDGRPDWMQDVARAAHGGMPPDDFRYELIEEALDALIEADGDEDDARDALPEAPCYNAERLRWLASHLERAGYCDEAAENYGADAGTIFDRIALGYRAEQEEVLSLVVRALADVDTDA